MTGIMCDARYFLTDQCRSENTANYGQNRRLNFFQEYFQAQNILYSTCVKASNAEEHC